MEWNAEGITKNTWNIVWMGGCMDEWSKKKHDQQIPQRRCSGQRVLRELLYCTVENFFLGRGRVKSH